MFNKMDEEEAFLAEAQILADQLMADPANNYYLPHEIFGRAAMIIIRRDNPTKRQEI